MDVKNWFGIHEEAIKIRDRRASMIANNLANVDTPNYKARDVNFKDMLEATMAVADQTMIANQQGHIQAQPAFGAEEKYRVPMQSSLDGNTVDKDIESSQFAKNALDYQASLSFLDGKIKMMMRSIRGD